MERTARELAEAEIFAMERPKFTDAQWELIWPVVLRALNALQRAQVMMALGGVREEE